VVCDIIILYVLKKRQVYKRKKYLYVEGDDPFTSAQPQVSYIFYALFTILVW